MDASILQGECMRVCLFCMYKQFIEAHTGCLILGTVVLGVVVVGVGFLDRIFAHVELAAVFPVLLIFCGGGVGGVVCKFLRAHGGCLGIGSRRRTWESAISLVELITGR